MLNQETKRKIDSARDILVGKVPDPKAQVEQITTALIYKFMDDMDKEAQELGGKARFFTNGYEKYAWTKLMDAKLSGHERLNLYLEAITSFSLNPHIPQLFRDIFKDAFLPYRSPETLNLFLKEINGFVYDHSENLGDAFEYLLSILGSQGDAGQFRTPRHIIDFIVTVVDPKKDETICDPACGTAGFLISAFKHILRSNKEKPLTPDERKKLMDHFVGYDISPDMVRLSKVNLYLHGFPNPTIYEYDTLTSEDKWDENFDVMLANPPFMTPKGGIKPHKRFSVQANRSEVLFVDYILEHLRPNGRAGIIVPEGIIFQSAKAYKTLRKLLIEDGLLAVVSLPAGVFNPYTGVKTSILIFDNGLAKKTKDILFLKIQNDGFDLGAQRRPIDKNDLPEALAIIKEYQAALKENKEFKLSEKQSKIAHLVAKDKIAESGEYNLSGDRYRETTNFTNQKWPMVELGKVIKLNFGERITKKNKQGTKYPVYGGGGESFRTDEFNRENDYVIARFAMSENCVRYVSGQFWLMDSGGTFSIKDEYEGKLNKEYVGKILLNRQKDIFMCARGGAQKNLNNDHFYELKIPLPPLEVQNEIVEQIEVKQKVIEAAKAVIENLERERRYFGQSLRKIEGVEMVKLGDVCDVRDGTHDSPKFVSNGYPLVTSKNVKNETIDFKNVNFISKNDFQKIIKRSGVDNGDIIMPMIGTIGNPIVVKKDRDFAIKNVALIKFTNNTKVLNYYVKNILASSLFDDYIKELSRGGTQKFISLGNIRDLQIPLPSLEIQKKLVAEMEEKKKIIEANKKLIAIMEQKIADVLSAI